VPSFHASGAIIDFIFYINFPFKVPTPSTTVTTKTNHLNIFRQTMRGLTPVVSGHYQHRTWARVSSLAGQPFDKAWQHYLMSRKIQAEMKKGQNRSAHLREQGPQ